MKSFWPEASLSEVLSQNRDYIPAPEPRAYPKLSVRLYGKGVVPTGPVLGSNLKMQRHQIARMGQIILSEIWGKKGAIGIVPCGGDGALVTSHFFLFDIKNDMVERGWLKCLFTANYFEHQLAQEAKGSTGYAAVRPRDFLSATIPLPPLPEQRRIVAKIDQVAARVQEAKRLAEQIEEEQTALLLRRVEDLSKDAPRAPMAEVAPVVRRPVEIQPDEWYPELGIRSFGNGTFHKDPVKGSEAGSKRLYSIEPGDLLFSNVFSWEGAIAVVRPADKGRFGSHRFITCVPDPKRATAQFLCHWFLSNEGLTDIRAASPGAAGRNKTLGIKKLEVIEVPLPPIEQQREFGTLIKATQRARTAHQQTATSLEALMPALLDQAFRGGI